MATTAHLKGRRRAVTRMAGPTRASRVDSTMMIQGNEEGHQAHDHADDLEEAHGTGSVSPGAGGVPANVMVARSTAYADTVERRTSTQCVVPSSTSAMRMPVLPTRSTAAPVVASSPVERTTLMS